MNFYKPYEFYWYLFFLNPHLIFLKQIIFIIKRSNFFYHYYFDSKNVILNIINNYKTYFNNNY